MPVLRSAPASPQTSQRCFNPHLRSASPTPDFEKQPPALQIGHLFQAAVSTHQQAVPVIGLAFSGAGYQGDQAQTAAQLEILHRRKDHQISTPVLDRMDDLF